MGYRSTFQDLHNAVSSPTFINVQWDLNNKKIVCRRGRPRAPGHGIISILVINPAPVGSRAKKPRTKGPHIRGLRVVIEAVLNMDNLKVVKVRSHCL